MPCGFWITSSFEIRSIKGKGQVSILLVVGFYNIKLPKCFFVGGNVCIQTKVDFFLECVWLLISKIFF